MYSLVGATIFTSALGVVVVETCGLVFRYLAYQLILGFSVMTIGPGPVFSVFTPSPGGGVMDGSVFLRCCTVFSFGFY